MFKREFIGKKFFVIFLILNFTIIFFSFLFTSFSSWSAIMFAVGELLLFLTISIITINFYKKYNNDFFLKRMKIFNFTKNKIKVYLFLLVFYYAIIFIFLFLIWSIILGNLPYYKNIFHKVEGNEIPWRYFNFTLYFYFMFMETILIIWFNYFLLHFIKNVNFIYAIIIIFFIWELLFGNLFLEKINYMDLSWRTHSDEFIPGELYPSWYFNVDEGLKIQETFSTITSLFLPWTNFGIIGRYLSAFGVDRLARKHHWMDFSLSHSTIFYGYKPNWWIRHLQITPFIILSMYMLLPRLKFKNS